MAETMNIALTPLQAAWVTSRKQTGGFASATDVIRDLIRHEQDREDAALEAEFEKLQAQAPDSGPEPIEEINRICREVKREGSEARLGHD